MKSRAFGFVVVFFSYLIAAAVGIVIFHYTASPLWLRVLVADLGATGVIYLFSMIVHNASLYDPYWSVQPVLILFLLAGYLHAWDMGSILLLAAILFWGVRLTANWAYTFHGLNHQDWRYDMLQQRSGKLFFLVNLFGIQLFPTLVVYSCILPAVYFMELGGGLHWGTAVGVVCCFFAAGLQLVADCQMQTFRKNSTLGALINHGLWRYSRHPNYLGEIMMWWGVYFVLLTSHPSLWYLGAGALINTLMFVFISIPMAEKRLAGYKPDFSTYKQRTCMLLPFKKSSNSRTTGSKL